MALPTPRLPPVTMATLPVSSRSMVSSFRVLHSSALYAYLPSPIGGRNNWLQVPGKPVKDDAEAFQPMAWLPGARQFMILVREAHEQHLLALLFQGDEQLLRLLHRAAQVVFGMDDQYWGGDVFGI